MAGVGNELPHTDLRGPGLLKGLFALVEGELQPVQHRVECQADIAGLRARRGLGYPLGEVPAADRQSRVLHSLQRPQ